MSTQRQYEKVSGGSNNRRWEPQKDASVTYSDANPAIIEGYYMGSTPRTSNENGDFLVHEVHTVDDKGALDESVDFSLGMGIDSTLQKVKIGTFVCIHYKGKKASKIPGRKFNDTDVFQDPKATPYKDLVNKDGAPAALPPSSQTAGNVAKNPAAAAVSNPFPSDGDLDELPF